MPLIRPSRQLPNQARQMWVPRSPACRGRLGVARKHTGSRGSNPSSPACALANTGLLDSRNADRQSGKWHVPLPKATHRLAYETILYDVADTGVATITLNQPD